MIAEHVHYLPDNYSDTEDNWTNHGVYLGHTAGLGQQWSHGFAFQFAGTVMASSSNPWGVGVNGKGHFMSGALTLTLLKGVTGQWKGYAALHGSAEKLVMFDREDGIESLSSASGAQLRLDNGAAYMITSEPQREPGTDLWYFTIDREDGFVQSYGSISTAETSSAQMDFMRDFIAGLGNGSVSGRIRFRQGELSALDYKTLTSVSSDRKWRCLLKGGNCTRVTGTDNAETPFAGYNLELDYTPND